jgi:hypothetical protein
MSREEEVSVGGDSNEDYEVVPMGPVRKLERRIDSIEEQAQKGGGAADEQMIRDVLDIMKSNQKIVNDMTESTHELKNSVEDLTHKMDEVVDNMNSFMDLLKDASEVDMEGEIVGDMQSRIAEAIGDRMDEAIGEMQSSNQQIVNSLDDLTKTMRRQQAQDRGSMMGREPVKSPNSSGGQSEAQQSQQPAQAVQKQQASSGDRGTDSGSRRSGRSRDYSDSERMRKLRNRLNGEDEEQ